MPPGPRRRGGVARGSKGAGGRSRRLLRQQRRLPHHADAPGRHSCFIHPYTLTRVTRGSQCQQHAAVCTRQVGVLVRRQWTLDTRNFGYQFTWVLNGFVLALNASTYLLVEQPPLSAQPASVYRDDMGCDPTEPSGRQGCVCHVPMDEAASNGQYNVGADATECGRAILASANAVFAFRGFLFLVINALFVNEAVFVPAVIADKRFFAREHGARAHSFLISPRISPYLPISPLAGARAYSVLAWHLAWLVKLGLTAALKALFYTPCFYFIGQLRPAWSAYLAAALVTGGMGLAGSAVESTRDYPRLPRDPSLVLSRRVLITTPPPLSLGSALLMSDPPRTRTHARSPCSSPRSSPGSAPPPPRSAARCCSTRTSAASSFQSPPSRPT